ncbi:DRG1, partial [Symbiodinium sp. CCMP2456]
APRFIKYNLMRTMHQQDDIIHQQLEDREFVQEQFGKMTERIDRLCQALIEGDASPLRMRAALGTIDTSSMCSVHTTQDFDGSKRESMEREIVEQPHLSKRVLLSKTLADAEGSVKLAMERLEQLVLSATEGALKQSTAVLETLLLEAQCGPGGAKQQTEAQILAPAPAPVAHTRITIEDVK